MGLGDYTSSIRFPSISFSIILESKYQGSQLSGIGTKKTSHGARHESTLWLSPLESSQTNTRPLHNQLPCSFGQGQIVDTVVMNSPFGSREKSADMEFLSVALKVASQAVYSLHKTSTREHIKRAALRDYNASSAEGGSSGAVAERGAGRMSYMH